MTSSLVGSEMCIRDRHNSVACVVTTGMSGSAAQSAAAAMRRAGKSVPVSYTHLTLPTICSV
eukprot:8397772-Prorocentrum_lima.AAC.1